MARKYLFSAVMLVMHIYSAHSQVANVDAARLNNLSTTVAGTRVKFLPKDSAELLPVLLNYFTPAPKNYKELADRLSDNPFIDITGTESMSEDGGASPLITQSAVNTVFSTPVTSAADGLAQFLIKRAKQELLISFFSNLQDSSKYPEFRILFPNTALLIDNFNSWEYSNIINTMRESFNKDVKQLMGNISNLVKLDSTKYTGNVAKRVGGIEKFFLKQEGRILSTALQVGNGLATGQKIPDIIHIITGDQYLGSIMLLTPDEKNIIKLLDVLSYSVRSGDYQKSYITPADFTALISDNKMGNIFLGLIYQQLKDNNIKIGDIDATTLLKDATRLRNIKSFITNLLVKDSAVENAIEKLNDAKKNAVADLTALQASIFENADEFFQTALNTLSINPSFKLPAKFQAALTLSKATLQIAQELTVKNYSAALISTLGFINQNVQSKGDVSGFSAFLVKYGAFAANIVQSGTPAEAESAIEAIALPAGSAAIKKQSSFNIALNAYLGGFWGNEYLAQKAMGKWAPISGVYAPVGITFSKGLGKGGSISALLNVIDIGAIASYRLQDDSTAKLPDVTLQNIFAPGVGVIYGLPRWPVSIGYTYQLGPEVRTINASTVTSAQPNKRWQFFLGVDIPLFNLFTKTQ
jgi:hypothetical protein